MTELEQITSIINSKDYVSLPNSAKKELRRKQKALVRQLIKDILKQHIEPILMTYDLDSDIRIYNDGEDGIKVDFVEYWSDVDNPSASVKEESSKSEAYHTTKELSVKNDYIAKVEMSEDKDVQQEVKNEDVFLQHKLDWSQFNYGMTVDSKYHQVIFDVIGKTLERGENFRFKLLIDDKVFDAVFECPNIKNRKDRVIRFMYKSKVNSPGKYLQDKFPQIYNYIKVLKDRNGGRFQVTLPDNLNVMLFLSKTSTPAVYRMTYKGNK